MPASTGLVTLDEIESVGPLSVKVGEKEQTLSLPDVGAIVRRLSVDYELNAADVIAFLTYLTDIPAEAGETVEVSCPDIGVLKNPVQAEIAQD